MSPSNALQARIKAFEALGNGTAKDLPDDVAQLADSPNPLDVDSPPPSHIIPPIIPQRISPALPHKTSLLDLKDWVIDDGPARTPRAPLIKTSSPPKAPPLPPRKASAGFAPTSPHMLMPPDPEHTYPPALAPSRRAAHAPASSISSFHSVSLSSDGGHPADEDAESLDESFENVSTPSVLIPPVALPPRPKPKPPAPAPKPSGIARFGESGAANGRAAEPPKLPQRPVAKARSSGSSQSSLLTSPVLTPTPSGSSSSLSLPLSLSSPSTPVTTYTPRRPAPRPPPPGTRSPASSITKPRAPSLPSTSASHARHPPPLTTPHPAARARYDALFTANVRARLPADTLRVPKKRANAGWRGLSVDLDLEEKEATLEKEKPAAEVPADARVDGQVVKCIWLKSRLEPETLRSIWAECDPGGLGSLDREAFARGMWRIDEELRRAQMFGLVRPSSKKVKRAASRPILR
ncbi:hypothetical protein BV25DRAFT_1914236 [Artomyces pyxidatus]|uniref:Uncharacterized protein n=1 Tax=Artomyces pyxidatus TaxID=48021 RepID=A0ACB8T7R1_9AGAM|nr:hypothetical protein BV25DRAFT_1914236 [Artomyces pyxidatus]